MGSKKKKKRGGSGRKSKDHSSSAGDDQELLSDELTALTAIFQDDFEIVSESPVTQFSINIRPHSDEMGIEESNVSARLFVRCLPGYPFKCPRLEVTPGAGVTEEDCERLLSMLLDQGSKTVVFDSGCQLELHDYPLIFCGAPGARVLCHAKSNAREGRVMIFNLVEAAQEFLSEIVPLTKSLEVHCSGSNRKDQLLQDDAAVPVDWNCCSEGTYVYASTDLYGDLCCDDTSWTGFGTKVVSGSSNKIHQKQAELIEKNENINILNSVSSVHIENFFRGTDSEDLHSKKSGGLPQNVTRLSVLGEEIENGRDSLYSSPSAELGPDTSEDSASELIEDSHFTDKTTDADVWASGDESVTSFVSVSRDTESKRKKSDLLMVHLLRLACSSKGSLAHSLPEVASELYNVGLLSEWARGLAAKPSPVFGKAFDNAFGHRATSSGISQFWKPDSYLSEDNTSALPNSRYLDDFEEVRLLGRGGFGRVVLCKNKLDGRHYAVKKIRLMYENLHLNEKILREVATLARLQHHHVVRYYQAWTETGFGNYHGETASCSRTAENSTWSNMGPSLDDTTKAADGQESTYLYIQMEYCPRTLREDFESYNDSFDAEYAWHLFRQIVEGLAHIHSQGIIHRDLNPNNIFFDARNEIKIGDFGLAKFSKLEKLDDDQHFPTEASGFSIDKTGQVGTYFYRAPEIEQKWPHTNEKVDMYSLGVVFFELWHPFRTGMERINVLSDLKLNGSLPPSWVAQFPVQSALLQRLMSPSPSDRPSTTELLQHALPPRMEDEWLNDILRTIKTSEDSYVYDRVVSTIFDEERLTSKAHHEHGSCIKVTRNVSTFKQYTEVDTEFRDNTIEVAKEIFKQHGAKRLEISPMRLLDDCHSLNRKSVKVLTRGGNMLELCHEIRTPFINWIIANQKLSFKRYEISWVYRRAIGHSTPNRFLQGDFDIIGGASPLTEADAIKVMVDIATRFFNLDAIDIRLNHGQLFEAIWSWVGISSELKGNVAELLSLTGSSCPLSTSRKSNWSLIRRQLLQDFNISEAVVDRLQTADLRFCGSADLALARLRGALSHDKFAREALEELSSLFSYLRVWKIENNVSLDVLMPPTESYCRGSFFQEIIFANDKRKRTYYPNDPFGGQGALPSAIMENDVIKVVEKQQIYLKESIPGSVSQTTLIAVGGRYDHLLHRMWYHKYKSNPPGAVGVSIALEKFLIHSSADMKPFRYEPGTSMLICSKGGGGLLQERMELVEELWQAKMKAVFVPLPEPSFTEQYEYASEHDIKCLIIITEASLHEAGPVKVRHLELKKEKEVERGMLIKFLTDAISTQFRILTSWS